MARPTIPLESFDTATLWPVAVYKSFLAAEAAGHNRGAIYRAIESGGTHHGYGWRHADALSRLPQFVSVYCLQRPESPLIDCIPLWHFQSMLSQWVKAAVDSVRLRQVVKARFGIEWTTGPGRVGSHGRAVATEVETIRGLVWA